MADSEDFGKLRQPFLGTVLLVTGKEDNVFALAGTIFALASVAAFTMASATISIDGAPWPNPEVFWL